MADFRTINLYRDSRENVYEKLQSLTGLRKSPRLTAAAEIIRHMAVYGEFTRADVLAVLKKDPLPVRTVDRALVLLEGCGAVRVMLERAVAVGGGTVFQTTQISEWHEYDESIIEARAERRAGGNSR